MSLTDQGSRKRFRCNFEDEISEFTPLSKRINNLHINNVILPAQKHIEQHDARGEHKSIIESNTRISGVDYEGTRNLDSGEGPWMSQSYNPDLNSSENPYYYESNRLLFDLYMERVHRLAMSNGQYI